MYLARKAALFPDVMDLLQHLHAQNVFNTFGVIHLFGKWGGGLHLATYHSNPFLSMSTYSYTVDQDERKEAP